MPKLRRPRIGSVAAGISLALGLTVGALIIRAQQQGPRSPIAWEVHDPNRQLPPVVTPGPAPAEPAAPPSDAVILFGGQPNDLAKWSSAGSPEDLQTWKIENGILVAGKKYIRTKDAFGDCQLHIEWMAPTPPKGDSQARGNSGVFLMGRYEIQVLDCYNNKTYADGMAGSIYGQYPPLVNACRPPGEWQTYDIIFRRPRFSADGKLETPARATIFHNGVLVQNAQEMTGPTAHKARPEYKRHEDKLPIAIQDHGNPVKFRNIWIRPLE